MASSEEIVRNELHERLSDVVGHHGAAYLMARVPPMEWDHLASKDDIGEVKAEIAGVRADLKDLRKDTMHEFAMVRTEMTGLKHEILGAFRAELTVAIGTQARILVVQHVVLFLAFAGFALATR